MKRLLAAVIGSLVSVAASAQTAAPTSRPATRVACVGDSITFGVGVRDPKTGSYPALLARMLGDDYEVRNFGVSGTTALAHGNMPYVRRKEYVAAQDFKPDVVVIMLGTNDSKHPTPALLAAAATQATTKPVTYPDNWSHKADFVSDYRAILDAFKTANPNVKLFAATPVPAYWRPRSIDGINPDTIRDEIVPLVRESAQATGATIIDLHAALAGQPEKFPDGVHPNSAGARVMAETVYAALTGKPVPATQPAK